MTAAEEESSPHVPHLADRLTAARRERFVGREAELDLFRAALLTPEPPFAVVHIHGPGGVGKSTLLRAYARLAREMGRPVILLDRIVEPSPAGFGQALRGALGVVDDDTTVLPAGWPADAVLMIDTYELLAALDGWLREIFLPQLPASTLVVIAGRTTPGSPWRADDAWAELTRILPLRNLRPEESQTYLAARGVDESQHAAVLAFTHGHPLALSLAAEVLNQGDGLAAIDPRDNPDVVRILLERFTRNVPDAAHRRALEICAHTRVTTESLLAAVLDEANVADLFQWLRERSFIERGPHGLFPHDLARDVLDADWRWRDPRAYRQTHARLRKFYQQELLQGVAPQSRSADIVYLLRHYAGLAPFYDWTILGQAYLEPAGPGDRPFILETIRRFEGVESAEVARYWLDRQPGAFHVFRTAADRQLGLVAVLMLAEISATDAAADPAMNAAQAFLRGQSVPLNSSEILNCVRFWGGRETYQTADVQSLVALKSTIDWLVTPHMAWTLATTAHAPDWREMFARFNFDHTGEVDFVVGRHQYGVFTHDWRRESVIAWFEGIGARLLFADPESQPSPAGAPALLGLSQPAFADAVRQALRDYTRPDALAANPLMRARLVTRVSETPTAETLQALLREAADALTGNPKDRKLYRAIHYTYLEPARTQEAAAERLDLPFSTYRYHLRNGLERITTWLWRREAA